MTAYIKLSTNEYPRHDGDIAIDPAGASDYVEVQWVDRPAYDKLTQRCAESVPEQIDEQWHMTWVVRDATPEEIENAKNLVDPRNLF